MRGRRAALGFAFLIAVIAAVTAFYFTGMQTSSHQVVRLRGSGATFPQPQLEAWMQEFMKAHPNVEVEYSGVGSGAGQEQFFNGLTDFCGSDPPLTHEVWVKHRGEVLQIPYVLGAVTVVYNLPELSGDEHLNVSGEVLALMYSGQIKYWDDPRILALNPALKDVLPHREVVAVHRSDASGTTQIFTTFLHSSAPTQWPDRLVGKTIDWPVDSTGRGIGGKGNAGVTAVVVNTEYSIGYVEWSYAIKNRLRVAAVLNREGKPVLPSMKSIQEAASQSLTSGLIPLDPREDFSKELQAIVNPPGDGSYPITSFSHIIIWTNYTDRGKQEALREFIMWIMKEGRNYMVPGYAPVPQQIAEIGFKAAEILASP
ncbi:MAG: phosphate ABC transporter substrate-binding protein PstS [Desulfurococcales archaeon]|nr:phosphate ABC transporter substrate-binding protein PstS [Desulfurococcales archaeon]